MCLLSNNVYDYVFVSQGKITIAGVDDGEECTLTDVSLRFKDRIYSSIIVECPHHPKIFGITGIIFVIQIFLIF